MFADLNPASGGSSLSYRQLADRIAVTYSVVRYGGAALNNFQIEMFFDGTIRITWLATPDASSCVAGLSKGSQPSIFSGAGSDFSTYPAPAPPADTTPPTVSNATGISATQILITFSEEVSAATANGAANYVIPGLSVTAAARQANTSTLLLTVSNMTVGNNYTVTAAGVRDTAGNMIGASNAASFAYTDIPANGTWTTAVSVGANATTANATGLSPLTAYFFRVLAFNAGGDATPSATASAKTFFPLGTTADANANGYSDFLEYALAITDATRLATNLPAAEADTQNYLTLRFVRPEPAPADVEYQLWASDDIATWTQIANPAASITVNGTTATVVLKDSVTLTGKSKRFLKLVVVQKP